jgi:cytochrome c-type biogenesis protein CcmH/NrfF
VGSFTIRMDALKVTDDGQKQMVTGHFTVLEAGKEIAKMYPAKWFFRKHESDPTTEVAIRRKLTEDLYLNMSTYELSDQSAQMEIYVNPLVNWIWFGFAVMALGTGIALLPERTFAFAMAKLPAEAATTAGLFLVLLLGLGRPAFAQHDQTPQGIILAPRNALESELRAEMGCTCGTCAHEALSKCACGTADRMRRELRAEIDQGKTRDQIITHFAGIYGGYQFLSSPPDQGFNRLAWLFPYAVAGCGAIVGAFVVLKWSRRHDTETPLDPASAEDTGLQARLDQELENLD